MASGTVTRIETGWPGTAVGIEHKTSGGERFVAVYGHINSGLSVGQKVSKGASIGSLYNWGGNSHLHLGVRPLGSGESGSSVDLRGQTACSGSSPAPTYGYVNPIPWLASRSPSSEAPNEPPKGNFDEVSSPPGGVRVRGWTFDPDDKRRSLKVHVYVGGPAGTSGAINTGVMADKSRPDVNRVYPGVGDNHGYDATFETPKRGRQEVCVYAINIPNGSNPKLGCKMVLVADPDPKGRLDAASSPVGGKVRVRGWTFDPNDNRRSLKVHVYVGGPAGTSGAINTGVMADKFRPDVNRVYPGVGDNHGYDATFETPKRGKQRVCAYGINVGFGRNKALGCQDVVIADPPPPPVSPPASTPVESNPAPLLAPMSLRLRLTHTRLHRGRRGRRSIYLRFNLSAPGRVHLSVMRRQSGVRLRVRLRSAAGRSRVVRRCVGSTGRNRRRLARQLKRRFDGGRGLRRAIRRSRCRRWAREARIIRAGEQGASQVRISARIGKRRLPRGIYRIHGRATSVAGSKSDLARSNRFRVVR